MHLPAGRDASRLIPDMTYFDKTPSTNPDVPSVGTWRVEAVSKSL
jgi:hypothetical protein